MLKAEAAPKNMIAEALGLEHPHHSPGHPGTGGERACKRRRCSGVYGGQEG